MRVKSIDQRNGKNDPDSITWPTQFVVESGEDEGVPVNHWFTEKQMGRLSQFLMCFGSGDVKTDLDYDLDQVVGQSVQGYVEYNIQSGFNEIKDFKPLPR